MIQDLIQSRSKTHGDFEQKAIFIQEMKRLVHEQDHTYAHLEALDNIIQKIGRIVYGDADEKDHWRDIAGYALLAESTCTNAKEQEED